MFNVKIIADSISEEGKRITTFQLMYPRFIHSELMTHRVFSRNASSSRAIPVKKMLEMIRNEPAMPVHWGANQPGMQANGEVERKKYAEYLWRTAAINACAVAEEMSEIGLHKQVANRILEPFQHMNTILTATEFDNFFELRCHPDADPNIQVLAKLMRDAMLCSMPKLLKHGEWHLPYVTEEDIALIHDYRGNPLEMGQGWLLMAKKISAARCCRVSYLKHDGTAASIEEDLALCDRLAGAQPIHASPFEHQATPDEFQWVTGNENGAQWLNQNLHGNLVGWIQYRKQIEASFKS